MDMESRLITHLKTYVHITDNDGNKQYRSIKIVF